MNTDYTDLTPLVWAIYVYLVRPISFIMVYYDYSFIEYPVFKNRRRFQTSCNKCLLWAVLFKQVDVNYYMLTCTRSPHPYICQNNISVWQTFSVSRLFETFQIPPRCASLSKFSDRMKASDRFSNTVPAFDWSAGSKHLSLLVHWYLRNIWRRLSKLWSTIFFYMNIHQQ